MRAAVVIPTRNAGPEFEGVLSALGRQTEPFDLLVLDSASTDGTAARAAGAGARVEPIDPATFNHGAARNAGMAGTDAPYVAFLTQDALPHGDHWLEALVDAAAGTDGAAGAYCRQIPKPDCHPFLRDRLESWAASRKERVVQEPMDEATWADLEPLQRLAACAFDDVASCLVREAWQAHPFPESAFGEDVAWAADVLRDGWRIVYEPESAVVHSHGMAVWKEYRRIRADHRNLFEVFGVHTVPDRASVRRNTAAQSAHYAGLLDDSNLSPASRLYWRVMRWPYAWLENLAQYQGARDAGA